jgi:hypothetical protein
MRVIYDYGFGQVSAPHVAGASGKREAVVVISLTKEPERGSTAVGEPNGNGAYDVRVSDEARASNEVLALSRGVKDHENAHLALLSGVASSPVTYDTVRGPNGETIAVGGRIAVDMSEVPGDPEATLHKARAIISAANAPHDPSAGDMRTASRAYRMASAAEAEIAKKNFLV